MNCPKCGYENETNALSCSFCKEVLRHEEKPKQLVNEHPLEETSSEKSGAFRTIFIVIIAILIGLFVKFHVIGLIYIASASMEPTLKINDHFWVNKLVYLFRKPIKNEIIVFKSPVENVQEVKRVIGAENDNVEIIDKIVYVNKIKLDEPYIIHTRGEELLADDSFGPYVVPPNSLFVLGDNRDESKDSRNWENPNTKEPAPFVPLSNVEGKLILNK